MDYEGYARRLKRWEERDPDRGVLIRFLLKSAIMTVFNPIAFIICATFTYAAVWLVSLVASGGWLIFWVIAILIIFLKHFGESIGDYEIWETDFIFGVGKGSLGLAKVLFVLIHVGSCVLTFYYLLYINKSLFHYLRGYAGIYPGFLQFSIFLTIIAGLRRLFFRENLKFPTRKNLEDWQAFRQMSRETASPQLSDDKERHRIAVKKHEKEKPWF